MRILKKLTMILMVIVSFSAGLVNISAFFALGFHKSHLALALLSFLVSYAINQDIILEEQEEKGEFDETF